MANAAALVGLSLGMISAMPEMPARDKEIPFLPAPPLRDPGGVAFWFRLPHALKPDADPLAWSPLSAPGIFRFQLKRLPNQVEILWTWEGTEARDRNLRIVLPRLPGGEWMHFATSWDGNLGLSEAFLNGTPLREPGTKVEPGTTAPEISAIHFDTSVVEIAGLITGTPQDIRRSVDQLPESTTGSLTELLGAKPLGPLPGDESRLIYQGNFRTKAELGNWRAEGPAVLALENGVLSVASELPNDIKTGNVVLWLDQELPDHFRAEWDVQIRSPHGLCIVFFCASGVGGEDVMAPTLSKRDGEFSQYHSGDIQCYHISYYANTPATPGRLSSNLRKNPGFHLVSNGPPAIPSASLAWHRITLRKQNAQIQLAVDGELKIDWKDDGQTGGPALIGGKLGWRQMPWTIANYRNLKIYALEP